MQRCSLLHRETELADPLAFRRSPFTPPTVKTAGADSLSPGVKVICTGVTQNSTFLSEQIVNIYVYKTALNFYQDIEGDNPASLVVH